MILNDDQKLALRFIERRYKAGEKVTELAGAAGTGKTTMVKAVIAALANGREFNEEDPGSGGVAVVAPTNKAAQVLRSKGIANATTIHRATTKPKVASEGSVRAIELDLEAAEAAGDSDRVFTLTQRLEQALAPTFRPSDSTPYSEADLIILDEGSMVGEDMAKHLEALGPPVLVVGDRHQLAPVKAVCPYFQNLNSSGTIELTQIKRQGADSGILHLATAIREGRGFKPGKIDANCSVVDLSETKKMVLWPAAKSTILRDADTTITGSNRVRRMLNKDIRGFKFGLEPDDDPTDQEPYISYSTNRFWGLAKNDTIACRDWTTSAGSAFTAKIETPNDPTSRVSRSNLSQSIYAGHFRELYRPTDWTFARHTRAAVNNYEVDFAYCLTAHRMQGSESDSVVVIADRFVDRMGEDEQRRWLYTAVTRARKKLVLIINSPWH